MWQHGPGRLWLDFSGQDGKRRDSRLYRAASYIGWNFGDDHGNFRGGYKRKHQ
jgi:hypothetical protein